MKLFQSKAAHMEGQSISVSYGEGYPTDAYPNGGGYCYHDFIEIEFFASGGGIHHLNGIPYRVDRGYFYLLMPGDYHYYSLDEAVPFRIYNVKLDTEAVNEAVMSRLAGYPRPLAIYLRGDEYGAVLYEMELLHRYKNSPSEGEITEAILQNCVERIILLLMKNMKRDENSASPSLPREIAAIVDYVGKNFKRPVTSEDMSALTGLTPHYFSSYFKKHTGVCFCDYVNRVRLFHAAELLETTELSVKEVAAEAGFGSQSYFTRQFTKQFEISPAAYRSRRR